MTDKKQTNLAKDLRKRQTEVEKLLWFHLRNRQINGVKFRRQQVIGKFIVDFVSQEYKLVIELDGGHHNSESNILRDERRTKWLQSEGYKVLRFWNNEVIENIHGVLQKIVEFLTPTLSPNGRGSIRTKEEGIYEYVEEESGRYQLCPMCKFPMGDMPGTRDAVCHNCGFKDPCCE